MEGEEAASRERIARPPTRRESLEELAKLSTATDRHDRLCLLAKLCQLSITDLSLTPTTASNLATDATPTKVAGHETADEEDSRAEEASAPHVRYVLGMRELFQLLGIIDEEEAAQLKRHVKRLPFSVQEGDLELNNMVGNLLLAANHKGFFLETVYLIKRSPVYKSTPSLMSAGDPSCLSHSTPTTDIKTYNVSDLAQPIESVAMALVSFVFHLDTITPMLHQVLLDLIAEPGLCLIECYPGTMIRPYVTVPGMKKIGLNMPTGPREVMRQSDTIIADQNDSSDRSQEPRIVDARASDHAAVMKRINSSLNVACRAHCLTKAEYDTLCQHIYSILQVQKQMFEKDERRNFGCEELSAALSAHFGPCSCADQLEAIHAVRNASPTIATLATLLTAAIGCAVSRKYQRNSMIPSFNMPDDVSYEKRYFQSQLLILSDAIEKFATIDALWYAYILPNSTTQQGKVAMSNTIDFYESTAYYKRLSVERALRYPFALVKSARYMEEINSVELTATLNIPQACNKLYSPDFVSSYQGLAACEKDAWQLLKKIMVSVDSASENDALVHHLLDIFGKVSLQSLQVQIPGTFFSASLLPGGEKGTSCALMHCYGKNLVNTSVFFNHCLLTDKFISDIASCAVCSIQRSPTFISIAHSSLAASTYMHADLSSLYEREGIRRPDSPRTTDISIDRALSEARSFVFPDPSHREISFYKLPFSLSFALAEEYSSIIADMQSLLTKTIVEFEEFSRHLELKKIVVEHLMASTWSSECPLTVLRLLLYADQNNLSTTTSYLGFSGSLLEKLTPHVEWSRLQKSLLCLISKLKCDGHALDMSTKQQIVLTPFPVHAIELMVAHLKRSFDRSLLGLLEEQISPNWPLCTRLIKSPPQAKAPSIAQLMMAFNELKTKTSKSVGEKSARNVDRTTSRKKKDDSQRATSRKSPANVTTSIVPDYDKNVDDTPSQDAEDSAALHKDTQLKKERPQVKLKLKPQPTTEPSDVPHSASLDSEWVEYKCKRSTKADSTTPKSGSKKDQSGVVSDLAQHALRPSSMPKCGQTGNSKPYPKSTRQIARSSSQPVKSSSAVSSSVPVSQVRKATGNVWAQRIAEQQAQRGDQSTISQPVPRTTQDLSNMSAFTETNHHHRAASQVEAQEQAANTHFYSLFSGEDVFKFLRQPE